MNDMKKSIAYIQENIVQVSYAVSSEINYFSANENTSKLASSTKIDQALHSTILWRILLHFLRENEIFFPKMYMFRSLRVTSHETHNFENGKREGEGTGGTEWNGKEGNRMEGKRQNGIDGREQHRKERNGKEKEGRE